MGNLFGNTPLREVKRLSREKIECLCRETWETLVLTSFYASGESSFIFKGGSALRLLYGSGRMSSDLDFDESLREPLSDKEDFFSGTPQWTSCKIERGLERAGELMEGFGFSDVSFSPAKEGDGTVRYKTAATAVTPAGAIRFVSKIEVSRRPAEGLEAVAEKWGRDTIETEMRFTTHEQDAGSNRELCGAFVRAYTPLALFLMKVAAVASPSRTSTRDVYDMAYIWKRLGLGSEERRTLAIDCIKTFARKGMNDTDRGNFLELFQEKCERFPEDLEAGKDIFFCGDIDTDEVGLFVLDFASEFSGLVRREKELSMIFPEGSFSL